MKMYCSSAASVNTKQALRTYASIGLETEVMSASPQRLITLLFDGALAAIRAARLHMQTGNIAERGMAISKAIAIVDAGLKASVDTQAGGELAKNLVIIYELVIRNLISANRRADISKLDLAAQLLTDIRHAWTSATNSAAQAQTGNANVAQELTR